MDTAATDQVIQAARADNRTALSEIESKQLLQALGVPTTMPRSASSATQAAVIAKQIGFPVALKVLSPDITHKSDVGGVVLGLTSLAQVEKAFKEIRSNLASKAPSARFTGVAVQAMAKPGIEMLAGITHDQAFGSMLVAGLGGVLVEVFKDVVMRPAPIDAKTGHEMLEELKGSVLLRGMRGAPPADFDAFVDLLVKLGQLAHSRPDIREMDLNPVMLYPDGLMAVDARVALNEPAADAAQGNGDRTVARRRNLEQAIAPRTIVVIGDKQAGGYIWLRAQSNYKGQLYSVQIDPKEIPNIEKMGVTNYLNLSEVPQPIDLAITAVPRQVAPMILKNCLDAGVHGVQFFTSGFSETGEELGIKLEKQLKAMAADSDIALVGPNCMGLYNPEAGLCCFPGQPTGAGGDVCFISQSGTHMVNMAFQGPTRGFKINKGASIGNAIVLQPADYLELMGDDPATRVIGMYVEGIRDGRRFLEVLKRTTARHPVVIWKGGVTEAGARATFSHTASLATPGAVWNAIVRAGGAVEVRTWDALVDALAMFARSLPVKGRRVGLVAMTGGQSVFITDTFASAGMDVPALSQSSYDELKTFFNTIGGSYRNPMDAAGTIMGPGEGNLVRILNILDRDPVIDLIVLEVGTGTAAARWASRENELVAMLDKLSEFNKRTTKPFSLIMHHGHTEDVVVRARQMAVERGMLVFGSFERAAQTLNLGAEYWAMHS
ncbi:MAG TPA: acetate--CoA ligase family protein [Candidatus Binataceae bacterium]|nr:acetate--CoA ligase family protein [Candidatus Binataceae bacterium]